MQRKIAATPAPASVRVWRAIALASGATALVLSLQTRTEVRPLAPPTPAPAATTRSEGTSDAAASSLSGVHALAQDGSAAALEALLAIAAHAAPEVASAALKGVVQIGGARARAYLAERFAEARSAELPELAHALAQLGGAEARAILLQAASSTQILAREAAREAIATLDTPDARAFMLTELAGPQPSQAVSYFNDCQDARAVPSLERLARESTAELRSAAIAALFAQGESAEAAIERLLRGDPDVSNDVLEFPAPSAALRRLQRATCIARLRAGAVPSGHVFDFLAKDPTAEARQALVLSARDPASRDSAIDALGTRGDTATLEALSQLAEDADPELAARAECALLSAPDSRSRPFLLRTEARTPGEAATALMRIGAPEAQASRARRRELETASEPAGVAHLQMDVTGSQADFGS